MQIQLSLLSKATLHASPLARFLLGFLSKPVEWRHGVKRNCEFAVSKWLRQQSDAVKVRGL